MMLLTGFFHEKDRGALLIFLHLYEIIRITNKDKKDGLGFFDRKNQS
jgi:hypothetical protein